MNIENIKPIEILLVEDSPGDVRLTQEAFKESKVINRLHDVGDGVEAMAFLRKERQYASAVRPDLILLDLNLPKKSGIEVLREIKTDPNLKRIPVIILTISQADEDIIKSYDLNANAFVAKPIELSQFLHAINAIGEFWLSIVRLPDGSQHSGH